MANPLIPRTSHIDGHRFDVADADSWMRSKNKAFVRKTASTALRTGSHEHIERKTLMRLANRVSKR